MAHASHGAEWHGLPHMQVLAQKQAAAIRARAAMVDATQKLHSFLHSVDEQHQILRQHKRPRYLRGQ